MSVYFCRPQKFLVTARILRGGKNGAEGKASEETKGGQGQRERSGNAWSKSMQRTDEGKEKERRRGQERRTESWAGPCEETGGHRVGTKGRWAAKGRSDEKWGWRWLDRQSARNRGLESDRNRKVWARYLWLECRACNKPLNLAPQRSSMCL